MNLRDRLATALARTAGEPPLLAGDPLPPPDGRHVDAAVLVPVTDRAEPGVLLTLRTATLRKHAGQVAFPGGRRDPEDDGPVAAALREAEEEIGLPRDVPAVAGLGDLYRTWTGYAITPVVAAVPPDLALVPHEAEVAAVFEVPLAFLLDPANHVRRQDRFQGRLREFLEIRWQEFRIWGVTAALIANLGRRLRPLA